MRRYYQNDSHFEGPGSPIFVIMGGEGGISPETGIFYPWITEVLAKHYKALVRLGGPPFEGPPPQDPAGAPVLRGVAALRPAVLRLGAPEAGDEHAGGAGGRGGAHKGGAEAKGVRRTRQRELLPRAVARIEVDL